MIVLLVACAAFVATLIGGTFALKFRDHLHLILGFSAGAVAGVALFDLLPEAINLGTAYHAASTVALFIALGLFGYLILDRLILLHTHDDPSMELGARDPKEGGLPRTKLRGAAGALTLSGHSFLDGVAIGVGFQASAAIGLIITAAVLTHDFSDGINTVNLVLRNGGSWKRAFRWLLVDAVAPIVGAASTLLFHIPDQALGLVLAIFVGTFLYLSLSDLIPESHHRHPRMATTLMTLLGALVLFLVVHLAGG
jgi:ZIP family zinc transporter